MQTDVMIAKLFDFQKFHPSCRLAAVIKDAHKSLECCRELPDDEVEIWAAGEPQQSYYNPLEKKDE